MSIRISLCALIATSALLLGCPQTADRIVDACEEYNAFRHCHDKLSGKMFSSLNCPNLAEKFRVHCSVQDVKYLYETFKQDRERVCAMAENNPIGLTSSDVKTSFKLERVSKSCIHATDGDDLSFVFGEDI